MPRDWTILNSVAALAGARRTQPCEAGRPSMPVANVAWMAKPPVKKIEFGIGASSYLRERHILAIHCGR